MEAAAAPADDTPLQGAGEELFQRLLEDENTPPRMLVAVMLRLRCVLRTDPPAGTPGHGHIGGEHGYDFGKCPDALPESVSTEEGEKAKKYIKDHWRKEAGRNTPLGRWRRNLQVKKNGVTGSIGWGRPMPVCLCTVCGAEEAKQGMLFAPTEGGRGAVWLGGLVDRHTRAGYHEKALAAANPLPPPPPPARGKGALSVDLFHRELVAGQARMKEQTSRRVKKRGDNRTSSRVQRRARHQSAGASMGWSIDSGHRFDLEVSSPDDARRWRRW
eukprot:COSAG01_NODE_2862_length_6958_cov_21.483015_6_plen_272_part_00